MKLPKLHKVPKVPQMGRVAGFVKANKTAIVALSMGVIVAVPTTLYVVEKQKNNEQPTQIAEQTKDTTQTNQNTGEQSTETQQPSSPGGNTTTPTTKKSTQSNTNTSSSVQTPTQSTPTPATPTKTIIRSWTPYLISQSPASCTSNCPYAWPASVTFEIIARDNDTGKSIPIRECYVNALSTSSAEPRGSFTADTNKIISSNGQSVCYSQFDGSLYRNTTYKFWGFVAIGDDKVIVIEPEPNGKGAWFLNNWQVGN